MKKLVKQYEFDPLEKRIYFPSDFLDKNSVNTESFLLITNLTTAEYIYLFNDPDKGGTFRYNFLNLEHDTTSMSSTDKLQIFVDVAASIHMRGNDGETLGVEFSPLHVVQTDMTGVLVGVWKELRKMNMHLESITDLNLTNRDLDGET